MSRTTRGFCPKPWVKRYPEVKDQLRRGLVKYGSPIGVGNPVIHGDKVTVGWTERSVGFLSRGFYKRLRRRAQRRLDRRLEVES
jgi:hypothetical protein